MKWKEQVLWDYFWSKRVAESKFLSRYWIWVNRRDFDVMRSSFNKEYNVIHPGKSYRSNGYWKHIHGTDEGEYFCLHQDTGNMSKFFVLGIIHLILDVIPGYIYCFKTGVPAKSLTIFPRKTRLP
jgi:hypothetical protein